MSMVQAPTIFESFNARSLDPMQVARRFVPSDQFDELIKRRHTLLVGPRGSGKTTLLKMLQPRALASWGHDLADQYRSRVDFSGVFVASDLSWGKQLESLGNGKLDEASHRLLSVATFTLHILKALIVTIEDRQYQGSATNGSALFRALRLSPEQEALFARAVCSYWRFDRSVPSLMSIRHALTDRMNKVYELASKESMLPSFGRNERLAAVDFVHLHFLKAATAAIETLDDLTGERGSKWALLFDELELAPRWIQEELVRSLRSTDDRFLFKLALNPFTPNSFLMQEAGHASPDNDFSQIPLWYAEKKDSFKFCTSLWYQLLEDRGVEVKSEEHLKRWAPDRILGDSYFESPPSEWRQYGTAYHKGSKLARRFASLAHKDPSFRAYLKRHELDPRTFGSLKEARRAAKVRKVAPIVAVREFYRRPDVQGLPAGALRSRKSAILYSGAESLFAITEGNPRWFIAILDRLLEPLPQLDANRVDFGQQAEVVYNAAERFRALLATIAVPRQPAGAHFKGVLNIMETVSEYFHDFIVRSRFRPDPPGTFYIDRKIPDHIVESLGLALSAGALVSLGGPSRLVISELSDLRDLRFRISYLLAPIYGLPLRLGRSMSLTAILAEAANLKHNKGQKNLELW
jgi:hypothetical protein